MEERVEIEGNVGQEEGGPRVGVRRHTLQKCKRIAHSRERGKGSKNEEALSGKNRGL